MNSFVYFKAIEERDEQKKRADNLQSKITTLEKDNEEVWHNPSCQIEKKNIIFKFKGFGFTTGFTIVLFRQQEFQRYRQDIDLLIEEKNDLGESFLSQQSFQSDRFSDSMSEKSSHVVIY